MSRKVIILFFQAGAVATAAEMEAGTKLGARFRNASQVLETDNPEKCDAVAGLIPKIYAKHPRAQVGESLAKSTEAKSEVADENPSAVPPVATEPIAPIIAPAPVEEEKKSDDPLAGITESEVEGFKVYSVDAIIGIVKRGDLPKVRAIELEKRGKNRPTCIKRLTELA